ncbi:MAG: HAMP domain-containing histidine kinase, partial [Bacteroidales bacterium]|nr:HAMP domain-containing histidine kinase [Bacteroidales bacterium]
SNNTTINSFRSSIEDNDKIISVLDTLLQNELIKSGINYDFQYAVTELGSDSIIYSNPVTVNPGIFESKIKTIIFDESFFFKAYSLYIFFPGKTRIIFNSIWLIVLSSIAIVCVIIILILFFIRTLLHQRKLSEMKSDFIHNMTHEFKTPISNIDLALDTINKQGHKNKIVNESILSIIREENSRLKDNVDLILQTSFMDYDKLKFNKEPVNINDLICRILKTFEPDLAHNGSIFKKKLEAENAEIMVDETHFTNAICNVIDNALKYTPENPIIEIKTENLDNKLLISFRDNGVGISEKEIKRIFDKFYRVSTGKIHDIKGFGLGLTYVKYVVDAHGGEIKVKSELGKGSEFRIILFN